MTASVCTLVASPYANLANIARALEAAGSSVNVTDRASSIAHASRIVLPGVGNFGASMRWLESSGVAGAIRDAAKRGAFLLGICVGHQVLLDASEEDASVRGLGFIEGVVRRFKPGLPVPQIGWNAVTVLERASALFDGIDDDSALYFVNSFAVHDSEDAIATSEYGERFTAAVRRERIFGVQFHPEKSSRAGLRLLRNFLEISS